MKTALVLFAHGSPVDAANDAVREVAREAGAAGGFARAEVAFLEPCPPGLAETVAALDEAGFSRVLVVPYFLTLGLHLRRDLPRIVDEVARVHPSMELRVTRPLEGHTALAEIVVDRARDVLGEWQQLRSGQD